MDNSVKTRLQWIKLYEEFGDAGLVCRRCGISRPTLRTWLRRYESNGEAGLQSRSQRPKRSPGQRVSTEQEKWIGELRKRRLGARRIQSELVRQHQFHISLRTIHKALQRLNVAPLKRKRRPVGAKRYEREVPGDRVQMDNMKLADDLYQYTAIDDCTRLKVIGLYGTRSAQSTLQFIGRVLSSLPFPVQRFQTDRGQEFFAYAVQDWLLANKIKFRPTPPASPHLNGKVERTQKTDWDEFYSAVDLDDPDLPQKLMEWQSYYNLDRPHGSLKGKTPWEKWLSAKSKVPPLEEIQAKFDPKKETAQLWYFAEQDATNRLKKLKPQNT